MYCVEWQGNSSHYCWSALATEEAISYSTYLGQLIALVCLDRRLDFLFDITQVE